MSVRLHVLLIRPSQAVHIGLIWSIVMTFSCRSAATKIEKEVIEFKDGKNKLEVPGSVFGFSNPGLITVRLSGELEPGDNIRYFLCNVSDYYIRDFSYQRRQQRVGTPLNEICGYESLCGPEDVENVTRLNVSDITKPAEFKLTPENFSLPDLYIFILADCSTSSRRIEISLNLVNPDSRYKHLGFEEALFPILAATVVAILLPVIILLVVAVLSVRFALRRAIPYALIVVVISVLFKILFAILTLVYFLRVGITGKRPLWYLYTRMFIASSSDVAFVIATVSISSGTFVFPSEWFVDEHSPSMFVYIVVTLQLVIFISVKTMFPYNVLGVVTYAMLGLGIGLIVLYNSVRNIRFLKRYSRLITRAHIDVKTTPIGRLLFLYYGTGIFAPIVYVAKIAFLTTFDYLIPRPDLMWATLELCDVTLIIWLTVFVFPMRRSPLYVNMSNVSNARLLQAETWRSARRTSTVSGESAALSGESGMRGVQGGSTAATGAPSVDVIGVPSADAASLDANTAVTADAASVDLGIDTQPPWVAWTSGMPLPQPDITTWGGLPQSRNRRRPRERILLPMTVVLGMPTENENSVVLRVGWPTNGAHARPAGLIESSSATLSGGAESNRGHGPDYGSGDSIRRSNHSSMDRRIRLPTWRHSRFDSDSTASTLSIDHETSPVQTTNTTGNASLNANINGRNSAERLATANLVRSSSLSSTAETTDGVVTTGNNT